MNSINKRIVKSLRRTLGFFCKIGPYFFFCFSFRCKQEVEPVALRGKTMGTTYTVRYFRSGLEGEKAATEVKLLIDELLKNINLEMSTYIPDSNFPLLTILIVAKWHILSPRLLQV